MNRRSFISRLAAVVVVCPALRWVPMSVVVEEQSVAALLQPFLNGFAHCYIRGLHSTLAHLQTIGLETPPTTLEEAARFTGEEHIYKECIQRTSAVTPAT